MENANGSARSDAPFPYVHLEEAITVPRALFENGARSLSREQLAGALGVSPGSGSYSLKLGASRLFGLHRVNRRPLPAYAHR